MNNEKVERFMEDLDERVLEKIHPSKEYQIVRDAVQNLLLEEGDSV